MKKTEIHLWTAPLTPAGTEKYNILEVLSPDERKRAEAFRFEKHRSSFVVGRAMLRFILGSYLQQQPRDIRFKYGRNGKPALDEAKSRLHFNLAHSENRVVYAMTEAGELGVDVELVRPLPELESIAQKFFSPEECHQLLSLPAERRIEGFFNCWTRKEAYLKAVGDGLMVPLNSFQVSLLPGQPAAFLKLPGDRYPMSQWDLFHVELSDGYVGALATPFPGCTLQYRRFSDAASCFQYLAGSASSFSA